MYQLEYKDEEYMELFNCIKDQLNKNPSDSIDQFLLLKNIPEKIIDKAEGVTEKSSKVVKDKVSKKPSNASSAKKE